MSLHPLALISFCQVLQDARGNKFSPLLDHARLSDFPGRQPKILLRLTARIGLPLYHCWDNDFQNISHGLEVGRVFDDGTLADYPENPILRLFSMKKLPGGRAKERFVPGIPRPNILLARVDGKELRTWEVHLMHDFIRGAKNRVKAMSHLSDSEQCDIFFGEMRPEKFVEFWNREVEAVVDCFVECPVKLGCKACGEMDGPFRACEKCGVVKYCSPQCQESDRTAHKRVCVKEMGEDDEVEQAY